MLNIGTVTVDLNRGADLERDIAAIVRELFPDARPRRPASCVPATWSRDPLALPTTEPAFNVAAFRVGGLQFLRIGEFQISFCRTRKPARRR